MSIPPDVAQPVVYGVLGSGLVEVGSVSARRAYSELADRLGDDAGERIEAKFEETLKQEIDAKSRRSETGELDDVLADWEAVWENLDAEELLTDEADDAAEAIVNAIGDAKGFDPTNAGVYAPMEDAAKSAYVEAIDAFYDEIEDTDLQRTFSDLIEREILQELRDLQARLGGTKGYRVHDTDAETLDGVARRIVKRGGGNPDIEFVDRDIQRPDANEILISGPAGAGKTRQMSEWVREMGMQDAIEHVVVPDRDGESGTLATSHDASTLKRESFEGDVLLVWDDVPPPESQTFASFGAFVNSLESRCRDLGYNYWVIATARTSNVDPNEPGKTHAKTGVLPSFEPVTVENLGDDTEALVAAAVEAHDVTLGGDVDDREDVLTALIAKAQTAGGTPLYIEAVLTVADDPLTVDGIEDKPTEQRDLWRERFEELGKNSAEYGVLAVLKLCKELRLPTVSVLVEALGEPVSQAINIEASTPSTADIERLVERGFVQRIEPEDEDEARLYLHDVRASAVDLGSGRQRKNAREAVSAFLVSDLDAVLDFIGGRHRKVNTPVSGEWQMEHERHNPAESSFVRRAIQRRGYGAVGVVRAS